MSSNKWNYLQTIYVEIMYLSILTVGCHYLTW